MNFLSQVLYLVELVVRLVLAALLIRGPFRKYLFFSLYVIAGCLTDATGSFVFYKFGQSSPIYRQVYWTDSITMDLLLFLVVILLTYTAMQGNPMRPAAAKMLAAVTIVGLALPFLILPNHHSTHGHGNFTSQWFSHTRQIFNFAAAIMNLVLWSALLTNRRRDPQLVTLSIGVGILTSSAAIAWGARQWLPQEDRWPIDTFMTLAETGALLVWCRAFRSKPDGSTNALPPDALTSQS